MQNEIWKPIPSYEGIYEVSDFGNIKSLDRIVKQSNCTRNLKGLILSFTEDSFGYKTVGLTRYGKTKRIRVHRLVYESFVSTIKDKLVVDHINGDVRDNRLSNLQVITHRENITKGKYKNTLKYKKESNVFYRSDRDRWVVRFSINGKFKSFGSFKKKEQAISKAIEVKNKLYEI